MNQGRLRVQIGKEKCKECSRLIDLDEQRQVENIVDSLTMRRGI